MGGNQSSSVVQILCSNFEPLQDVEQTFAQGISTVLGVDSFVYILIPKLVEMIVVCNCRACCARLARGSTCQLCIPLFQYSLKFF